jgi:hypothetical protein
MRRVPAVVVLSLLCRFSIPLLAQQAIQVPTAPTRDPQAMSVLSNALTALGGSGIAAIQDTVVQATLTPPQGHAEGPGTATFKTKGAKIRSDATSGSKSGTSIFNNGREFRSSDHGMLPAHSANADHKRIEHLPALMLAQELARGDFSATYVGQESVEGQTVQHIRLFRISNRNPAADAQLTKNSELNIFVDTQTSRILKISFPYVTENDWRRSLPMEILYDDYRVTNGIAVPFHQRYFFNGQPAGELLFTSVAINQGTPDSVFNGSQQ